MLCYEAITAPRVRDDEEDMRRVAKAIDRVRARRRDLKRLAAQPASGSTIRAERIARRDLAHWSRVLSDRLGGVA